ncbi:DNA mismatch repair protein MutS [Russula earlei]|uniref:DNA mismatch repair protein MutS n=1 Tax=Russula earlei TaxID=71964 RepID=A0ACC0TX54_9AGAM|nr:DNA mismatch repair protein MutS [Russula earlei]
MSRTSRGTAQEPLVPTDSPTPDPDDRQRKRVRWNSDSLVHGDEPGDSDESSYGDKICLAATYSASKADDRFIDLCSTRVAASGGFFQIRPQKDFRPERGRNNVLSLGLLSDLSEEIPDFPDLDGLTEPRNAYEFMQRRPNSECDPTSRRWNASVRISNFATLDVSPLALGSMGALLDYLVREKAIGDLEPEGIRGLDVRGILSLSLDKVMQINADALFSLQVFETESHASIHSTKTKEGLSLFGTLDSTKTTLGRSLLRTWLLRPSLSFKVIDARHDAVECFTRPENLDIASVMHSQLGGIKNIPRILSALKAGKANLANWQGLVKFTFHTAMLRDKLGELSVAGEVDIVKKLMTSLDIAAFREVGKAIDWEESTLLQRVCVRPHIDEELDNRKHIYNGIDVVLSKVAEGISPTVPQDYATSLNVVYFPQLGFLVCVPMLEEWRSGDGIEVLDGWTFQFSSESHVYLKNDKMHDLDKHLGDLYPSIIDRELEIIHELAESVLPFAEAINEACDICAELDCLLCFAEATNQYNYKRPQMSEENVINIKQGRHPLQEQVVDTFVPNDILIVGGAGIGSYPVVRGESNDLVSGGSVRGNSVVICTGANACGKSVYLKQAALIQLMAQVGFQLPNFILPVDSEVKLLDWLVRVHLTFPVWHGRTGPYDHDMTWPSFVPAESATLGIVDKIFTRVQTRESVSKVQSAFMIDLNQVSLALRNSTARSLILLDEFGKGTAAAGSCIPLIIDRARFPLVINVPFALVAVALDGAALFAGVLKHLLARGSDCPKVLATTHFHELFSTGALEPQKLPITFIHMEIMFTTRSGEIIDDSSTIVTKGESITYLYRTPADGMRDRAVNGLSLESHAARCAQLFGVPAHVVRRAQYVTELLSAHELPKLLDEAISEEEQLDMDHASAICERFLEWDLEAQDASMEEVRERLAQVLGLDMDQEMNA